MIYTMVVRNGDQIEFASAGIFVARSEFNQFKQRIAGDGPRQVDLYGPYHKLHETLLLSDKGVDILSDNRVDIPLFLL